MVGFIKTVKKQQTRRQLIQYLLESSCNLELEIVVYFCMGYTGRVESSEVWLLQSLLRLLYVDSSSRSCNLFQYKQLLITLLSPIQFS